MTEKYDSAAYQKRIEQLEKKLSDKQKEADYYKQIAQEAGQKRLLEVNQMSRLIEEKKIAEQEREKVIDNLKIALDEVKTLQGLIPICASCKKIRDDKGYWNKIENYVEKHSKAIFSHGICPECSERQFGKEQWYMRAKKIESRDNE